MSNTKSFRTAGTALGVVLAASAGDQEACLIQVGATSDDWLSGCSSIRSDMVVGLSGGVPQQEVALVSDDPSTDILEEDGWEQQAENLWQRPD